MSGWLCVCGCVQVCLRSIQVSLEGYLSIPESAPVCVSTCELWCTHMGVGVAAEPVLCGQR